MRAASASASPSTFGQVMALFLMAAAGTAFILGVDLLLPSVAQSGFQQNVVGVTVVALILYGAWIGLSRANFAGGRRLTAWFGHRRPNLCLAVGDSEVCRRAAPTRAEQGLSSPSFVCFVCVLANGQGRVALPRLSGIAAASIMCWLGTRRYRQLRTGSSRR